MSKKTAVAAILVSPILITVALAIAGCAGQPPASANSATALAPAPARTETSWKPDINAYLIGLRYDPRQILAEQVGDVVIPAKPLPDEVKDDGRAIIICKQVKHHLSGNLDDQLILNPIHGIVWPGALVRADQELVRGTPTPVSCRRAPVWLSVDLPGIGGRGVFSVDNPSQGTVQAAIDGALDYWNNHQYREGYVSKSRSKYTATMAYSAEQLAASLGVSYGALQGSLATQFQATTSRENMVAVALFKQVFYTVAFEPPAHPSGVFDPSVTLDEVRGEMSADVPPAYVSSVDYGRILLLRIETSTDTLKTDLEAAVRYLGAKVKASSEYQKTLAKSKITLITIGGNAEVNTRAVDATRIEDLNEIIQGKNALYSKNNPGQPIAYTIRFLKDGRLAKMGFSTDYTEVVCERHPHGWLAIKHRGAYVGKFYLSWKEGDTPKYWSSGQKTHGWDSPPIELKGNAREIKLTLQSKTGLVWEAWRSRVIEMNGPPNKAFVATGTSLHPSW